MVGGAVGAVVQIVLVVFTLFYLFRDGDRIRHAVYDILPLERIQMHDIAVRTRDVIGATIYGVLVISAIQGTLGTIIFSVLGLAVAAAVGRGDVLPVDDPDGRARFWCGCRRRSTWR